MLLKGSKQTEITGPHTANGIFDWLQCNGQEVMDYPPHSPHISPNNFRLFGHHKKHLPGKWLATDSDVKLAVTFWQWTLDTELLYTGIQATEPQLEKCLNVNGDYMELWRLPSAMYIYIKVRTKFLVSECPLPCFQKVLVILRFSGTDVSKIYTLYTVWIWWMGIYQLCRQSACLPYITEWHASCHGYHWCHAKITTEVETDHVLREAQLL